MDILDILTGIAGGEEDARARMPLPDGPMHSLATLGVPPIHFGELAGGVPLSRLTDVAWRDANAFAPDEQGIGRGTPARGWSDRDNNLPRIVVRPLPRNMPEGGAETFSSGSDPRSYPNNDANVDPALADDRFDLRERDPNNIAPRWPDIVGSAAARAWNDFVPTDYDPTEPEPPLDLRSRHLPAPTELDGAAQARDDGRSRDDLPQQVESGGWRNNVPRIVVTPGQFELGPPPRDRADLFPYRPGAPVPDDTYVPLANLPALSRPSVGSVSRADLAPPSEETRRALFPRYTSKIELRPPQPRGPELWSYTPPPSERVAGGAIPYAIDPLWPPAHGPRDRFGDLVRDFGSFLRAGADELTRGPRKSVDDFIARPGDTTLSVLNSFPQTRRVAGGLAAFRVAANAAQAQRLAANAARGRAFERAALEALSLLKNNELIIVKGLGRSIPDALIRGVTEVKSGIEINNSIQLEVHAAHARRKRIPFNLVVSPATQRISQSVQRRVFRTGGTIQRFNPATGAFGPFP